MIVTHGYCGRNCLNSFEKIILITSHNKLVLICCQQNTRIPWAIVTLDVGVVVHVLVYTPQHIIRYTAMFRVDYVKVLSIFTKDISLRHI